MDQCGSHQRWQMPRVGKTIAPFLQTRILIPVIVIKQRVTRRHFRLGPDGSHAFQKSTRPRKQTVNVIEQWIEIIIRSFARFDFRRGEIDGSAKQLLDTSGSEGPVC